MDDARTPFSFRALVDSFGFGSAQAKGGAPPPSSRKVRVVKRVAAAPEEAETPATGKKVVFLAEDDDSVRELVVRALEADYDVRCAADGFAASEMITAIPTPALFILDVMMPHIDGFSLAKVIKSHERLKAAPLIFLTAKTLPRDVMTGIGLGARHYVQKPFKLGDLVEKVQRAVK